MPQRRRMRRGRRWALRWGPAGLVAMLGVLALLIFLARRGSTAPSAVAGDVGEVGESVPIEPPNHIPAGVPPQYTTTPPSSGMHYAGTLKPGFYDEDAWGKVDYPEGYLAHNLEHGYVIFWYDCSRLSRAACDELKQTIQEVMRSRPETKLIAFPYPGLEAPLVLTSWGRRLVLEKPDRQAMEAFVAANYNKAPEPNAP